MKRVLVAMLLLAALAIPSGVRADIAPPAQPPGSNLQPGTETTQVRMLAETVRIDVQPGGSSKSLGLAHVTADFSMRNEGQAAESMAARFPIGASDGWFNVNELHDLQITVDGKPAHTRRIVGEDPYNGSAPVPWDEFDVTFPPGQAVPVQVQYTLEASGEYPFIWFKYVLSTGSGWKDTIGSADIIVQLPYDANNQNLLLDTEEASFGTAKGGAIDGRTIRWHYENLEPTTQDNFEVNLVMPSAWEHLLAEQKNVEHNPRDGEAWGRLGKLCKELAFSSRGKGFRASIVLDPGGAELYRLALQAYEQAVTLLPKDALWHAGYADLLGYHAYFEAFNGTNTNQEAVHSMQEARAALDLAPKDPKVQEIAQEITSFFPDGAQYDGSNFIFLWLTAAPVQNAATLPPATEAVANLPTSDTPAPTPTATPNTQPTPHPTGVPASKPSLPICGSALLLPAFLAGCVFTSPGNKRKWMTRARND